MDDSFSLFAKSIRQQKINKEELLTHLKEISETQNKKDHYIGKVIKIQKVLRGHLYRKKFHISLDEINTKTVIDYLLEKKKKRIYNHSIEIISFFITKYVNKIRKVKKNNMLLVQYKIHCSNLIKARFKGVLVRKHVKEELLKKKARKKIFKHLLAFRTILILKTNTIQNLLIDIANIKYQLKNLDLVKDSLKIKELKNKLSKNINLFHDTYYFTKENCNWSVEKKTKEKWSQKYFDIINKSPEKIQDKNKSIPLSGNNGYTNYLLEFYNDTDDDNEYKHNFLSTQKKTQFSSTINSTKKKTKKSNKFYEDMKYETNHKISEFEIEEIKRENLFYNNMGKDEVIKHNEIFNKKCSKNINNTYRDKNKFNYKNNGSKMNYIREENKRIIKEINDIDLNNIDSQLKYSNIEINKNYRKSSSNIYQLREERPIKPLETKDILNCENPFGIRENNFQKTNVLYQQRKYRNSVQYLNNYNQYEKKNTKGYINIEENKQTNEDNIPEYGFNRINSGKINNYRNINFLNKDDKPVGGRVIDYEAMFGEGSEIHFDGDPFGGAKQFETDKSKIHYHKSNSTAIRKKPVYDARKAIEEAKLRESKEGKKEKHTEFRDFLREMKKITKEEKLNNLENNKNDKINTNKDNNNGYIEVIKKSNSDKKKDIENGALNDINNNYLEEESKYIVNGKRKDNNNKEKNNNKSSNKMLRKKLHDLEKAPAPILNIKGVKSKIECWFETSTYNNGNKYMEYSTQNTLSNKCNGQNRLKKSLSNELYDNNLIITKKLESKIENYVEKKLSQLNLQINKINDLFNIESYFVQKETKMKNHINIPYIKKNNLYVKKYSNDIYDILINDINKEYKNLK